jgi:methylmalonyl-CoA/ethylmalonyl-CoA epimerase
MFNHVHHLGIAVRDIDAAIKLYESIGGTLIGREFTVDGKVELAMLDLGGGSRIEPISPATPDSFLHRYLEERGEGLHHVAYAVDDITATLADLKSQGYELIDEVPRPGFGGHLIAFIKPGSTMGALWELVQE